MNPAQRKKLLTKGLTSCQQVAKNRLPERENTAAAEARSGTMELAQR